MIISDFAIKRPVVTVVTMLALVVFGLFALVSLDVDEFPDISAPIIFVGVAYPGAPPGQVEREVVNRLEEAFSAIPGVDKITSTSSDAFAQIIVQIDFEKEPDQASQDMRDAIAGLRGRLPIEMKEPIIRKFDPADMPIVSLVLESKSLEPAEMTILADPGVTQELRAINGVAQVNVVGGAARELSVRLDPAALRANGVIVSQVVGAPQSQNLASPVGRVNAEFEEQTIRLQGRPETVEDFRDLVVGSSGSRLVRLGYVARVADTAAEARSLGIFNGIGIDVTKARSLSDLSPFRHFERLLGGEKSQAPLVENAMAGIVERRFFSTPVSPIDS